MNNLLRILYNESLLGNVGFIIMENIKDYPITLSNMEEWLGDVETEEQLQTLAKSSLCSGNDERAIEEFVAEEEINKIKEKI